MVKRLAVVFLSVCLSVWALAGAAQASTLSVCANGCNYSSLQSAIDDAVPGDVILLRAGETFVGNYVLRAKNTAATAFITIRSDAADSSLPAEGVRLVPEGRPGANVALSALPRLLGQGGSWQSTPVISTEPGAHHYRLQFLDVDGSANVGYETLIQLGENTSSQTAASSPYALVFDRVYVHGHATKGMKRGIALDSRSTDILNSYLSEFMHDSDAQAIAGFNGAGPFRIFNNHLEASGENVMFGGSDPRTPDLVPSDIEIRGNDFFKPLQWRSAVMAPPSGVAVSAGGGGSLPSGAHYFKVVAVLFTGGAELVSAASSEVAVTVPNAGSVALSWAPVPGADRYRVYHGTSPSGETTYVETALTSLTYPGTGQVSGEPPATGSKWTSKNLLELKNAQRVTIDGNRFENAWAEFQDGYAVLLTPRNQDNMAPWSVVRDISFTNNRVRRAGGGLIILGTDNYYVSQQTRNVAIVNNVFEDLGGDFGEGRFVTLVSGPLNVKIDHNTIVHTGNVVTADGSPGEGFVYTNNFSRNNEYGVHGSGRASGSDTLNYYFPGSLFRGNVLAGGDPSVYPDGNFFPATDTFDSSFVDPAGGDYTLVAASPFNNAGTDGRDVGIDMTALTAVPQGTPAGGTDTSSDPGATPGSGEPQGTATLPEDWMTQDVGGVVLTGSVSLSGGAFVVTGAGADIWDTSDAFRYVYRTLASDGTIVARVAAVSGTEEWTKVGVMMRDGLAADAAHASMFVTAGAGLAFQRRTVAGGISTHTAGPGQTAPQWVRLVRAGSVITASVSTDGSSWTTVGSDTFTMSGSVLVGLAVTSHDATMIATGVIDNVAVTEGTSLPAGWTGEDVGAVGIPGSSTASGGTFTVQGAGADVWGTTDAFHFVSRTLQGDGDIIARVAQVAGAQEWTKVGVMMRMTLDAGSPHAYMLVSAGSGLAFQRRTVAGGESTNTSISGAAPHWIKLARRGTSIIASTSADGTSWTRVGRDTFSIAGPMEVGLAVTSHDSSQLATGVFDNVRVVAR